jgi:anthranilate phosphoribosyltransferase
MTIQEALKKVTQKENLTTSECRDVFNDIMSGNATPAQVAGLLVGLRMKGETVEEIIGATLVMRQKATRITPKNPEHVVDTCGTGGDGANTFNISTAAAFVAAGAGAIVAKHGNRSVSSKCGSADVLEALGVSIAIPAEKMQSCLDATGICFLFAPALHAAMKHAIGPRKEIGVRTIFNILGPLTNPASAPNQLLGVYAFELTDVLASALASMGSKRAYVVHGLDRLDEISICGETRIAELANGAVRSYTIKPEDFGLRRSSRENLAGGDATVNAAIIRRDVVVLNAAFAIAAAGIAADPNEGLCKAAASIDSGAASATLEALRSFTAA